MYEPFFKLTGRPFAAAPNRHQFFPAAAIQHARQTLTRCIARAEGPALVIGPPGTGKSLLCQLLADDFRGHLDCVQLASGNLGTSRSLLQSVLHELELPYRGLDEGELRLALADRTLRQRNTNAILLLVDEAQVLPARLLEELRLMTNLVREGMPQIRLILVGSAELEERFASPKLESFSQRLASRCYLEAFNREESRAYVATRIAACGPDVGDVFTSDALDQLHLATEGVPRLINQLADHALVLAYAAGVNLLDGQVIKEAWSDLQQLPTPWNQSNHTSRYEAAADEPASIEFGVLDDEPAPTSERPSRWNMADDEQPATVPWPHFAGSIAAAEEVEAAPQDSDRESARTPFQFPEQPAMVSAIDDYEEEVVIDPYATLDAQNTLIRHRVTSVEGRALWAQLAPHAAAAARQNVRLVDLSEVESGSAVADAHTTTTYTAAAETPVIRYGERAAEEFRPVIAASAAPVKASEPENIDADLIVVEDDTEALELVKAPGFGRVRRQEYKQLFKKLRNG